MEKQSGTFDDANAGVRRAHIYNLTLGSFHKCGLVTGGAAYCWGYNDVGQLGNGTTTNRFLPTPVARP